MNVWIFPLFSLVPLNFVSINIQHRSWPRLHWLPVCFWAQCKRLFLTFKALYDSGLLSLEVDLSPIWTSLKPCYCHLTPFTVSHHQAGSGVWPWENRPFISPPATPNSPSAPSHRSSLSRQACLAPALSLFQCQTKTCFSHQAFGQHWWLDVFILCF